MSEGAAMCRGISTLTLTALLVIPGLTLSQSLIFKNYTTQDGLPDSRVAPIIQDGEGYLWSGRKPG